MASTLQPRALRYLAAVAQTGSIQGAAREVAISASAIDRQLLSLEEELGVPLFEREARGMRMTAAGEVVLALAQRWRGDLDRTLSELKQLQGVHQGQVRLVAMDSHANGLLPAFIAQVARDHPGITLEVEIATPDEAVRLLHDGQADVAVAFNVKPQRELHIVWTTELPLGCIVAADHPLAQRRTLSLKDVAGEPMAVQSRALAIRRYLERRHAWLLAQARPPLVSNSLQLVKSLVCAGTHVALTSELDAAPEILAGTVRFIPLDDAAAQPQSASVAISARRRLPRIVRLVAELLGARGADLLAQVRRPAARKRGRRAVA
jgi:DNA-binding transcriptional LysR family regulator